MGGHIGVTSEAGRGSEFWFTTCLGRAANAQAQRKLPIELKGSRALVVDASATNREVVRAQLTSWNMLTAEAPDMPTAVRLLYEALEREAPFQLVVTDTQSPGADADALVRIILSERWFADIKVVLMMSRGKRGSVTALSDSGVAGYLFKPIRQSEFFDCLAAAFGGPGAAKKSYEPRAAAHFDATRNPNARVLLAEDNVTNQQVAVAILRKLGLRVDAVSDGKQAITSLCTIPYDLVLMDVQMPEMDGLEASRVIRSPAGGVLDPKIPIVAMTANAMRGDREACLAAGMDDYLPKPVTPGGLAAILERWLSKPRQPEDSSNQSRVATANFAVFDERALLARLMDDRELARTIMLAFLEDLPKQIEALASYVRSDDAKGAQRQAHTIRGAALAVGATLLVGIADAIEETATTGDLSAVDADLGELSKRFARLRREMLASSCLTPGANNQGEFDGTGSANLRGSTDA